MCKHMASVFLDWKQESCWIAIYLLCLEDIMFWDSLELSVNDRQRCMSSA